ncbi:MAG: hypothetical protein ACJAU2_000377 [Maribacter sp.]|jgi:hypothetical protein
MRPSVFQYEDRSKEKIIKWLGFNEGILTELSATNSNIDPIDGRLLRVKAQSEVNKWKTLSEHTISLRLYPKLIENVITSVFKADYLLSSEKSVLIYDRLTAITQLAKVAQSNLKPVLKIEVEKGLEDLGSIRNFLQKYLEKQLQSNGL